MVRFGKLSAAIYWSLQGGGGRAEPSAASGGRSEAEAQCARELQEGAWAATHNDLCALQKPPSRPLGFRRRQKNTKKPGPTLDGAGRHNPARRGLPPWGALVRCCANIAVRAGPGSGGTIPPAAGCCPGAPWPAVARISPSAQDHRARSAALEQRELLRPAFPGRDGGIRYGNILCKGRSGTAAGEDQDLPGPGHAHIQ